VAVCGIPLGFNTPRTEFVKRLKRIDDKGGECQTNAIIAEDRTETFEIS
jgi:hypothetical protein